MFDFFRPSKMGHSMMARILAVGVVALVTSGSQVRCSSGDTSQFEDPPGESGGPTFATSLLLKDAAGIVRTSFQSGETITLELTVRNRSNAPVQVDFASGHQYDFFAFRNGSRMTVWLWSSTALFTQAASTLHFAANESRVFAVTWTPSLDRGAYEARGALLYDGLHQNPQSPHELGSTIVAFSIN